MNDRLLFSRGGTWSGPPTLAPGWEADRTLDSWRARARASFAKVFPSRPAVWKDPRNCLTLPFWRTVIAPPAAAVLIYRDPLEVARSLHARDGVSLTYGLALWDRYVRSASANLVGLPTIVADYARILDQPSDWIDEIAGFLRTVGVDIPSPPPPEAVAALATDLRHQTAPTADRSFLSDDQFAVMEILRRRDGPHRSWAPPDLGPEPTWVDDVLALRLRADMMRTRLTQAERLAQKSRIFRITRFLGGLRR
jgi:hypothetical protein